MANLAGLNLDPNVDEAADGSGDFTILPKGSYTAVMVGDEVKPNKAGNGQVWHVGFQITDGQFAGHTVKGFISLTNPNLECQNIGQGQCKKICNLTGVKYPPADTKGMYGKPVNIKVDISEFTSNNTGKTLKSNKITGYSAVKVTQPQSPVYPEKDVATPW